MNSKPKKDVKDQALLFMNYKDNSSFELEKKLLQKGYSNPEIRKVISEFQELNIINDERWLENYLFGIKFKPKSLKKVQFELSQKGFRENQIESKWFEMELKDEELALECAHQKLRSLSKNPKVKDKLSRHLASRGFDWGIIKEILAEMPLEEKI